MKLLAFCIVLLSLALAQNTQRRDLTLKLGDFESKAQITYPVGSGSKLPALLLIHGSTPQDMDATVLGLDGKPLSSIFRNIAEGLSAGGVVVLRYNKRYVSGPGQADTNKFYRLRLQDFLADAQVALNALRQDPRVDPKRIVVYGWSEGSVVAAQLVLNNPDVRGLVLHGPVVRPYVELFREQFSRVGLPYLSGFAKDGKVNLEGLIAAISGKGGALARSQVSLLFARDSTPQTPKLNGFVDQNRDGLIDLQTEALPAVNAFYRDDPNVMGLYASALALPVLRDEANKLQLPILILQGQNDANIPASDAQTLADALVKAGNKSVTFKSYAGLGHSLGKATSITDDNFRPIESQPIGDLLEWLKRL